MNEEFLHLRVSRKKINFFIKTVISALIGIIVLLGISIICNVPQTLAQHGVNLPTDFFKKQQLENTYNQLIKYEKIDDYSAVYPYLTPSERATLTSDQYAEMMKDSSQDYNGEFTVNNITVKNNVGIIDRTFTYCKVENCPKNERITVRGKKQFLYINGDWYMNIDNNLYCDRTTPYPNPPEFDRALSLITERLGQSKNTYAIEDAKRFNGIKNCLDIQYAASDSEMHGAEGVFNFSPESTNEELQISVSPRYQEKDDLLTAILLSHEVSHAFVFATGRNDSVSCYDNEAMAFASEIEFVQTLNKEEVSSLQYRYNNRSSDEVLGLVSMLNGVNNAPGATLVEKAKNYAQGLPYYQKQCGDPDKLL